MSELIEKIQNEFEDFKRRKDEWDFIKSIAMKVKTTASVLK